MRWLFPIAVLIAAGASAQVAPTPPVKSTPWNITTSPPAPRPPPSDSTLSLRLYEETDRHGLLPYRTQGPRGQEQALAVDVSAVMTRCADGSQLITALVIGGQLTPLDNRCPDHVPDEQAGPQCDPKRWTCETRPAP